MENKQNIQSGEAEAQRPSRRRYAEVPTAEKLAECMHWLEEHKAGHIVSIDLAERGVFTDALVVATASSARHAQSLADGLAALCRERNYEFLRMEGYAAGQWILVDLNDIIINIFLEPVRELYRLESLWEHIPGRPEAKSKEADA